MKNFINIITENSSFNNRLKKGFRVSWYHDQNGRHISNEFATIDEAVEYLREEIRDGSVILDYHMPNIEAFERLDVSTLV